MQIPVSDTGNEGKGHHQEEARDTLAEEPRRDERVASEPEAEGHGGAGEEGPRAEGGSRPDGVQGAEAGEAGSRDTIGDPGRGNLEDPEYLKDQLRRLSADFENYRRRSRAELERAEARGQDRFLEALVPVIVDLEASLRHEPKDEHDKGLLDGIRMVTEKLQQTLAKLGYTRIPTVGERMDPNRHEALFTVKSPEHPAKVVAQELAPGYERDGKVVLPAKVAVSQGE